MKRIAFIVIGLFAWVLFFGSPAYAATNCPTVTKADIAALFEQWDQSLQTGNPSEVAKNYTNDAILVPTVSNKVRHTHPEIEDYFKRFLSLKPDGRIEEQNIQIYCDVAVNSGTYTFAVVKDGQPSEVKARFTFVYRKVGDRWLIVDHHSSGMPEKITYSSFRPPSPPILGGTRAKVPQNWGI